VDFDGKIVEYAPDMLGELEPAFAVTVHKAQGSGATRSLVKS